MFEIELKSKKLRQYIKIKLGKSDNEEITDEDLKKIKTLKLDKKIIDDLSIGDLSFFTSVESLSLSGINCGEKEIEIINRLKNIKTLSITDSKIEMNQTKYLNPQIVNLIFINCEGLDINNFNANKSVANLTMINCKDTRFRGISQFQNLQQLVLPNNEQLTEHDIEDVWKIDTLKKVNLDGNEKISKISKEGVEVSQEEEYNPTETEDWHVETKKKQKVLFSQLTTFSAEQLADLKDIDIIIDSQSIEFLKSDIGQEVARVLQQNNNFSLSLNTTADLSLEDMEKLNEICKIDTVFVNTGWKTTQEMGYSYETYKAIKQEIINIVKDIDPNLTDEEKFKQIYEKITQNIKYDYAVLQASKNDKDYYASRNLENGLLNHTCVCAGYADILKNVLSEIGIESKYVEGRTNKGELHAWNQVQLTGEDGKKYWYNVDVTFDASKDGNWKYYLLNDEEFSKTHTPILERTEGHNVHNCNKSIPISVKANKQNKENNTYMNHTSPNYSGDAR